MLFNLFKTSLLWGSFALVPGSQNLILTLGLSTFPRHLLEMHVIGSCTHPLESETPEFEAQQSVTTSPLQDYEAG